MCKHVQLAHRKMVYGGVIILKVMYAELHKAQGVLLAVRRGISLCKSQQGRQQPAATGSTDSPCNLTR